MASALALRALLATAVLRSGVAASCAYGTHLMPRAEEGEEVPVSTFGYFGDAGPLNWASLDDANALCANGTHQSPIDMTSETSTLIAGSSIQLTLPDMPNGAIFENLGSTIEVVVPEGEAGTLVLRNETFIMVQCHFHMPGEHLDRGHSHAMEMHMVFQSEKKAIAVIGTYIVVGDDEASAQQGGFPAAASKFLQTIFCSVKDIAKPGSSTRTRPLITSELENLYASGSFQTYSGSLTTPPCSENVNWMVSTQKLGITAATFERVRNVLGFNARFTQNPPGEQNALVVALDQLAGK